VIVTITPNPALDLTYRVPIIELGETHRVPAAAARAGGKLLNVARVVHQQGHPVFVIAPAGGLTGDEFAAELAASGLHHHLVPLRAATRRTVALVDVERDQTSSFDEFGENHTPAEWQRLTDAAAAALPGAACPVGSGSLPTGADTDFFPNLVVLARQHGLPTVIDTSGPGLLAAARAGATVLKPNWHELAEATGDDDPVRAARGLLELGARLVLVSLREEGKLLISATEPNHPLQARLPRVLAGNPTGAGDAAVATAAVALATGLPDPETILRRATVRSAAAVLIPLAGEISPEHAALADELIVDRPSGDVTGATHQEIP